MCGSRVSLNLVVYLQRFHYPTIPSTISSSECGILLSMQYTGEGGIFILILVGNHRQSVVPRWRFAYMHLSPICMLSRVFDVHMWYKWKKMNVAWG